MALGLVCLALVLIGGGAFAAQGNPTATPAPIASPEAEPALDASAGASRPSDAQAPTEIREVTEMTVGQTAPETSPPKDMPGAITPDSDKLTPLNGLGNAPTTLPDGKSGLPAVEDFTIMPELEGLPSVSDNAGPAGPSATTAWTTIKYEGFEGAWPAGAWRAFDKNVTNGELYWDDDDFRPHSGGWSAWAANGGAQGLDPQSYYYANNMQSWTIYGPFDLSSSIDAEMLFYYWNQSEKGNDWFSWLASANGTNFYGYKASGDSAGWKYVNFDLTAVPTLGNLVGDSSVWIAFTFGSDASIVDDGPFIDDVTIQKNANVYCPDKYLTQYYRDRNLSVDGYVVCENWPINHLWGAGGPGNGIPNDNFSVRWTGQANIAEGNYTFRAVTDDGMRVWLDGEKIIDAWGIQSETEYKVTRYVTGGQHSIRVEYFEATGLATAKFRWAPAATACPTITQWKGQYWNNDSLTGQAKLCRNDSNIDFTWEYGSPHTTIPVDHFSARWTRQLSFEAGRYRFRLGGDDGVRLYVDGQRVIDKWQWQHYTEYTVDIDLTAGLHTVKVEYYERDGYAKVKLSWEKLNQDGTNLALNRPSYATSSSTNFGAAKGNDGNQNTRWSSSTAQWGTWWVVDLGTVKAFNQVKIKWEEAFATTYFVHWGNQSDCADIWSYSSSLAYGVSSAGWATHNVGNQSARCIGIEMNTARSGMGNYSFWEVEVYQRTDPLRPLSIEEGDMVEVDLTTNDDSTNLTTVVPTTDAPPEQ